MAQLYNQMHKYQRKTQPEIQKKELSKEVAKTVAQEVKHEMKKARDPKHKERLHAMANKHKAMKASSTGTVIRPTFVSGQYNQQRGEAILSAWDKMQICKNMPGQFNSSYVAGMNVTTLATSTFAVAN